MDPAIPATWTVYVAPTADDKSCPIALDNSRQVEQQAWLKSWIDQGPGGLKDRPKRGTEALDRLKEFSGTTGATNMVCTRHRPCSRRRHLIHSLWKASMGHFTVLQAREKHGREIDLSTRQTFRHGVEGRLIILEPSELLRERQEATEKFLGSSAVPEEVTAAESYTKVIVETMDALTAHHANTAARGSGLPNRGGLLK